MRTRRKNQTCNYPKVYWSPYHQSSQGSISPLETLGNVKMDTISPLQHHYSICKASNRGSRVLFFSFRIIKLPSLFTHHSSKSAGALTILVRLFCTIKFQDSQSQPFPISKSIIIKFQDPFHLVHGLLPTDHSHLDFVS